MRTSLEIRPGIVLPAIRREDAAGKRLLTRGELDRIHLKPVGLPCAFSENEDETLVFYFDPNHVTECDPDLFLSGGKRETLTLPGGTVIERMSVRRAAAHGFYTKDRLSQLHYESVEEPAAYSLKKDGSVVYFYDKHTSIREPLLCTKCGKFVRFKKKLCEGCYEEELAVRRVEGDAHRAAAYHMDRARVLFFDLELTGFYDRDEILSISIVNGAGDLIMNTLVKPTHTKKWKRTEKVHGITPAMVEDAPTLPELIPQIKEIFEGADNLIAYGVSTDFSHIKKIYETEEEQAALHEKVRCCANEFVRYAHEHRPDVLHASLSDAMACLGIAWDGIPHSSIADTIACMKVWEVLFPNYYDN